jgi:hypothetical protein
LLFFLMQAAAFPVHSPQACGIPCKTTDMKMKGALAGYKHLRRALQTLGEQEQASSVLEPAG